MKRNLIYAKLDPWMTIFGIDWHLFPLHNETLIALYCRHSTWITHHYIFKWVVIFHDYSCTHAYKCILSSHTVFDGISLWHPIIIKLSLDTRKFNKSINQMNRTYIQSQINRDDVYFDIYDIGAIHWECSFDLHICMLISWTKLVLCLLLPPTNLSRRSYRMTK